MSNVFKDKAEQTDKVAFYQVLSFYTTNLYKQNFCFLKYKRNSYQIILIIMRIC